MNRPTGHAQGVAGQKPTGTNTWFRPAFSISTQLFPQLFDFLATLSGCFRDHVYIDSLCGVA